MLNSNLLLKLRPDGNYPSGVIRSLSLTGAQRLIAAKQGLKVCQCQRFAEQKALAKLAALRFEEL